MTTARTRDDGLRRVSHITRWLVAGALAGAGALSVVAAKAAPGRASAGTGTGTGAPPPSPSPSSGGSSNSGPTDGSQAGSSQITNDPTGGLSPAPALPAPAPGGGSVRSGGS